VPAPFAVDAAFDVQIVRIRDRVRAHEAGTDRRKYVEQLADRPLVPIELELQ
jgi:hypothetical protein